MVYIISDGVKMADRLNRIRQSALQSAPLCAQNYPLIPELSPYLLTLPDEKDTWTGYLSLSWGNSWGIFAATDIPFNHCQKHFEHILMVENSDGQQSLFRYYDPRVIRTFLPNCKPKILKEFFGPIKVFTVEDIDPAFAISFWLQNYELCSNKVPASDFFSRLMSKSDIQGRAV